MNGAVLYELKIWTNCDIFSLFFVSVMLVVISMDLEKTEYLWKAIQDIIITQLIAFIFYYTSTT